MRDRGFIFDAAWKEIERCLMARDNSKSGVRDAKRKRTFLSIKYSNIKILFDLTEMFWYEHIFPYLYSNPFWMKLETSGYLPKINPKSVELFWFTLCNSRVLVPKRW